MEIPARQLIFLILPYGLIREALSDTNVEVHGVVGLVSLTGRLIRAMLSLLALLLQLRKSSLAMVR
jgi:hypothetical protein